MVSSRFPYIFGFFEFPTMKEDSEKKTFYWNVMNRFSAVWQYRLTPTLVLIGRDNHFFYTKILCKNNCSQKQRFPLFKKKNMVRDPCGVRKRALNWWERYLRHESSEKSDRRTADKPNFLVTRIQKAKPGWYVENRGCVWRRCWTLTGHKQRFQHSRSFHSHFNKIILQHLTRTNNN